MLPMLAHKFADHGHKIKYPAYIQPKLDGIRCIAIVKDGVCTLWSRTNKPILGVPHVVAEIERLFPYKATAFDGELYNHAYKSSFEKIVSIVRRQTPGEGHEIIQYHIYDLPTYGGSFKDRTAMLRTKGMTTLAANDKIKIVETKLVKSEDEAMLKFEAYLLQGYEGAMLRNASGEYLNKRSYDLQKIKEFDDGEFEIVGVKEGKGKLLGHAIFVCRTDSGTEFMAKMNGDMVRLKEYLTDCSLWQGKRLTVKYQGMTGTNKVPRFPVGVAIRDYE